MLVKVLSGKDQETESYAAYDCDEETYYLKKNPQRKDTEVGGMVKLGDG